MKLWLENEGGTLFGPGRRRLLELLAETGSLAEAARRLDMSYRAAWGRLVASEERLGFPLVERDASGRRGSRLTPEARQLLAAYQLLEKEAARRLAELEKEFNQWRRQAPPPA